jgi:5-formyltetrahydrofolate cyclo-ligase
MPTKPLAVGIGHEPLRLTRIHPRPHDVPMDLIVTERQAVRVAGAVPESPGPGREGGVP